MFAYGLILTICDADRDFRVSPHGVWSSTGRNELERGRERSEHQIRGRKEMIPKQKAMSQHHAAALGAL